MTLWPPKYYVPIHLALCILFVLSKLALWPHNSIATHPAFCYTCEHVREKTNNLGSVQVRHKSGCAVTEDGYRLEILYLSRREIVLSV